MSDDIGPLFENLERILERRRRIGAKRQNRNAFLRAEAVETGKLPQGCEYWLVYPPIRAEWQRTNGYADLAGKLSEEHLRELTRAANTLNGYVAFPKRHAPCAIDDELAKLIPVHGGISYAVKDQTAAVWGFDFQHIFSGLLPASDPKFVRWQCEVLADGLLRVRELHSRRPRLSFRAAAEELQTLIPESSLVDNMNFLMGYALPAILSSVQSETEK